MLEEGIRSRLVRQFHSNGLLPEWMELEGKRASWLFWFVRLVGS